MKKFIKEMLSGMSGNISSKRVCGVLGWLIVLGIYIYCSIRIIEAPEITDVIVWASVTLLGVETVTNGVSNAINKYNNKHHNEED